MAEAGAQTDPNRNIVTFEDVCVYFSPEEWELLDESQKRLYCSVILENFLLVTSLGLAISRYHLIPQPLPVREPQVPVNVAIAPAGAGMVQGSHGPCHRVENEGASSQQGISVKESQARILSVGPSNQKSHPCNMCDPILKDILHLSGQQGTSLGPQPHPCGSCGRTFWVTVNIDQIPQQQNGEVVPRGKKEEGSFVKSYGSPKSEKAFTCKEDEKDFLVSSALVQHHATKDEEKPCSSTQCKEALHAGRKDYKCSECGKAFSTKGKCDRHQAIHSGEKPYKCDGCEKSFVCNSSLQEHQRAHMGSKPNVCAECGKSFIRKSHFIQHQRIHSGAKPYECHECGKAFSRKDTLMQHQKIHSGERSFMCSQCGKAFLRKDALAEHQKSHTKERSYECDRCGKFFSHSSYVKVHKRIHSGARPYVCTECGKAYISHPQLLQHMKIHTAARPMDEVNVGNSLVTNPASSCIRSMTPEQSQMCSANVGGPTEDPPTWLGT
ncbi:zinc finger protein OZF [Ailuropoda melanoleuca]|uniref:zinc finger protein OZF n=1 Tax=Ailuropoda melanoleuca TaxID=9646 RepID=UPI0001DECF2C|nr:zinc finger protein OZF [Ailuropoda melanoleuca]